MSQTTQAKTGPTAVEAALNYLASASAKPILHASRAGAGDLNHYEGLYRLYDLPIDNGRAATEDFTLDRQGFQLVRHETAVSDFYDREQIAEIYESEAAALIKAVTGAREALVFDHTLRAGSQSRRDEKAVREPVQMVHNDYTDRSAPIRLRDHLAELGRADEAEAYLARRFAVINVWRSIGGTVESQPLAICDARSVAPADLIPTERRSHQRVGEIQQVLYNPAHRWTYFPGMTPQEALLIKTFDSATDGPARFTIHTAFEDPATAPGAPARESIESRCFAFF